MSAAAPIELLNDDDEPTNRPDEDSVRLFLEVTGLHSRRSAIKALQDAEFDVHRAISRVFQNQGSLRSSAIAPKHIQKIELKQGLPLSTRALTASDHVPKSASKPQESLILSAQWNLCMKNSLGLFVDPDFPPNQSSLDGRKQTSQQHSIIKCPCGLAASARSVQSEGPNYGRFYLACGQKSTRGKPIPRCKFFQWEDRNGSQGAGYATRYSSMAWEFFGSPQCCLVRKEISPSDVKQGAIGNCWFLSALAVVAEKPYLIRHVLPHNELNPKGCYQVNLCLDGQWQPIIVDSNLPVVHGDTHQNQVFRGGITSSVSNSLIAFPAFCAIPERQLWPALIEKAYAKAHGSYVQLSGGFIQEAFYDMTGAPTETIVFGACWDVEELWARLLSFGEAGFIMGVATSKGGDGLVGHHAYSVLQVIEVHDAVVGEQQKVTEFFTGSTELEKDNKKQKTTVRLVRIRNPWGKKEWKGDFSDSSDKWTMSLRKKLGDGGFTKNDGTFWMSYDDLMQRFHHMDVAKCREGWKHSSTRGCFPSTPRDPFLSSRHCYRLRPDLKTWAFISLVQPKKRANTKSHYWYADPSMIIMKRRIPTDRWSNEAVALYGFTRFSVCEVFLDPEFEYCCIPISTNAWDRENNTDAPFCITSYSAESVEIEQIPHQMVVNRNSDALSLIHRHLLTDERKLMYALAPKCLLLCCNGYRCMYFLVINASPDHFLSLRLQLRLQKGILISYGENNATHDIPKLSMKILAVVSSDGTDASAVSLSFEYSSDVIASPGREAATSKSPAKLNSAIGISMAAELLVCDINPAAVRDKGNDTIETCHWLAQVGAARSP